MNRARHFDWALYTFVIGSGLLGIASLAWGARTYYATKDFEALMLFEVLGIAFLGAGLVNALFVRKVPSDQLGVRSLFGIEVFYGSLVWCPLAKNNFFLISRTYGNRMETIATCMLPLLRDESASDVHRVVISFSYHPDLIDDPVVFVRTYFSILREAARFEDEKEKAEWKAFCKIHDALIDVTKAVAESTFDQKPAKAVVDREPNLMNELGQALSSEFRTRGAILENVFVKHMQVASGGQFVEMPQ